MHASSLSIVPPPPPPVVHAPPKTRIEVPTTRWRGGMQTNQGHSPEPAAKSSVAKSSVAKTAGGKFRSDEPSQADLDKIDSRFHFQAIRQKIEDMPAWLASLIIHLVLMLVLALITTSTGTAGLLVLTIQQGDDEITTELVEFSINPIEIDDLPMDEPTESPIEVETISFESEMDVASLTPKIEALESSAETPMAGISVAPKNMFSGRTGDLKQELLKAAGGTQATEDAVSLGLEWLKRQQLSDGSWSLFGPYTNGARNENKVSATAMAMLAFMGAGSTHRGGPYQKELWRAVRWLVKQQDRQGFMVAAAVEHEKMYAQAQAMIALCELYAMTGDSWIRPYAQAACDFACRAQSREGGWRYQPRYDSDTSVTGWFVMGLKSGDAAGLEVDRYIWPKVEKYLDSVASGYSGGYSYKVSEMASPSMTAEGLLCRQYMGWHRNMPGMAQGLGAIATNHPIDFRAADVYYWYYATQSLHHYGGPLWTQWNDTLKVELPAHQILRGGERGSWSPDDDAWGRHAGRLYTTCFSLYCLEVYYRHMPLYDPNDEA